jgi:sporulation protein YlmC with PRC-barrel domain
LTKDVTNVIKSKTTENNIRDIIIDNILFEGKEMGKVSDEITGRAVLNAKGVLIGVIQTSIKDEVSGEIISVLIKPSKDVDLQKFSVTERGEIIFPFTSLSSVKDIIILEEPLK